MFVVSCMFQKKTIFLGVKIDILSVLNASKKKHNRSIFGVPHQTRLLSVPPDRETTRYTVVFREGGGLLVQSVQLVFGPYTRAF